MIPPKFIVVTDEKHNRLKGGPHETGYHPANTDVDILEISNRNGVLKAEAYHVGNLYKTHADIIDMDIEKQEENERAEYERLKEKFEDKNENTK